MFSHDSLCVFINIKLVSQNGGHQHPSPCRDGDGDGQTAQRSGAGREVAGGQRACSPPENQGPGGAGLFWVVDWYRETDKIGRGGGRGDGERELEAGRYAHSQIKGLEKQVCLELQTGRERVRKKLRGREEE